MIQLLRDHGDGLYASKRFRTSAAISVAVALGVAFIQLCLTHHSVQRGTRALLTAVCLVLVAVATGAISLYLQLFSQLPEDRRIYIQFFAPFLTVAIWTVPCVQLAGTGRITGILIFGAFAAVIGRFLKTVLNSSPQAALPMTRLLSLESTLDASLADESGSSSRLIHLSELVLLGYIGVVAQATRSIIPAIACTATSWFIAAWILLSAPRTRSPSPENQPQGFWFTRRSLSGLL